MGTNPITVTLEIECKKENGCDDISIISGQQITLSDSITCNEQSACKDFSISEYQSSTQVTSTCNGANSYSLSCALTNNDNNTSKSTTLTPQNKTIIIVTCILSVIIIIIIVLVIVYNKKKAMGQQSRNVATSQLVSHDSTKNQLHFVTPSIVPADSNAVEMEGFDNDTNLETTDFQE